LILLTRILLIEDEFDEAKTNIRRAMKLSPTNTEALALYGHCLFREGAFAMAEAQYQKSLHLDSNQPGAHLGMGRLYLTRQQQSVGSLRFRSVLGRALNRPGDPIETAGDEKDGSKKSVKENSHRSGAISSFARSASTKDSLDFRRFPHRMTASQIQGFQLGLSGNHACLKSIFWSSMTIKTF
jgi:tetratricopeptide (TPR) repeat protein